MEGLADSKSSPSINLTKMLENYADRKVGLIIPGAVAISNIKRYTTQCGLYNEQHVSDWAPIVESIKSKGSKLIFQLVYGRSGDSFISENEIQKIIEQHVQAAKLAVRTGAN
jgi:2,4-dienoyl-CoA reductase-like NADH-dependent reductase (Old Yellow Enzyme family)